MKHDAFWQGFEKRAGLGVAAGLHIAQNAFLNKALRGKKLGKRLGQKFMEGLGGNNMPKRESFVGGLLSGTALPEYHGLKKYTGDIGRDLNKALRGAGVNKLTKEDQVLLRALTEGKFDKLVNNEFLSKAPAFDAIIDSFSKKYNIPFKDIMQVAKSNKDNKALATSKLKEISEVWRSDKSPATANVVSQFTRSGPKGTGVKDFALGQVKSDKGGDAAHGIGSTLGSAALAVSDPITGGINAVKSALTNQAARKAISSTSVGKKALDTADKHMLTDNIKNRVSGALEGTPKKMSRGEKLFRTYGLNSAVETMAEGSANVASAGNIPEFFRKVRGEAATQGARLSSTGTSAADLGKTVSSEAAKIGPAAQQAVSRGSAAVAASGQRTSQYGQRMQEMARKATPSTQTFSKVEARDPYTAAAAKKPVSTYVKPAQGPQPAQSWQPSKFKEDY